MASVECCVPAPPAHHTSGGVVENWEGLSVYISSPPAAAAAASKAVILVTDIMGWEAPLLRKLADKIATAGYLVVVPDYFHGDAFYYIEDATVQDRINEWLPKHPATPGPVEESKEIIRFLKKKKGVRSVGVAGFCWGGQVVVYLAKEADIQAAVLLHPSFVTTEDIKEVKVPIAILAAEIDRTSPPALIQEFEKILISKSEVPHFVKIYPGVVHGWTNRYDINDEKAVAEAEAAHAALLEWLGKFM